MNFQPSEEHREFLGALGKLLAQTKGEAVDGRRSFFSAGLDSALEGSGLLDAAGIPEFGLPAAALLIDEVSRLPAVAEVGVSAMVRPLICPDWPRPVAVVAGDAAQPVRFLCEARTVLFVGDRDVGAAALAPDDVAAAEAFFTYPMGRLREPERCRARARRCGEADEVRRLLAIATTCEITGALQGALDAVTEHVKNRRQFGRPLGSFQAVQHRLAAAATNIVAGRLLARKAASIGRAEDALLALGYVQDCAPRILYDLHQFMGAMGLTLEHPLYRWSYRVKLLISASGGASRALRDASGLIWGTACQPLEAVGAMR